MSINSESNLKPKKPSKTILEGFLLTQIKSRRLIDVVVKK